MVELENVVSLIAEGRFAEAEARLGTMAEEDLGIRISCSSCRSSYSSRVNSISAVLD